MALEEGIAMIYNLTAGLFFCRRLRSHIRMADKPRDYSDLPNWPRPMPANLACRYVGWAKTGFLDRVGSGSAGRSRP